MRSPIPIFWLDCGGEVSGPGPGTASNPPFSCGRA